MGFLKSRLSILWINLFAAVSIAFIISQVVFRWLSIYTRHDHQITIPDLSSLTLGQATMRLEELGLNYKVDTSRYDPAFTPHHIFAFAPQTGDRVKPGRVVFIQVNAGTLKSTTLPDIIYKNKRLALSQLATRHLLVKNITYVPDIAKETVLKVLYEGNPIQPGAILPYRAEIDLIIGQEYKRNVTVPDVMGLNLSSAQALLEENQFILGKVYYAQPEDTINAKVYRQDPLPGEIYDQGQYVNLWLDVDTQDSLDDLIQTDRLKVEEAQNLSEQGNIRTDEGTSSKKNLKAPPDEDFIIE